MKIEIKLDPEQYDMIFTALVQIAQASVRMADSWEAEKWIEKNMK